MLADIKEAGEALRRGSAVIVVDGQDRENEGDIVLAAEHATVEWLVWIIQVSRGFICAPMSNDVADTLELRPDNTDSLHTADTITVDPAKHVTTGISAKDRTETLWVLAEPSSGATDLIRLGHFLPHRAVDGGVRQRSGHTEAAVDLPTMAGTRPVGVIAAVVADDRGNDASPWTARAWPEEGTPGHQHHSPGRAARSAGASSAPLRLPPVMTCGDRASLPPPRRQDVPAHGQGPRNDRRS